MSHCVEVGQLKLPTSLCDLDQNIRQAPNEDHQLPVSAPRWQHWYQICFATFNITKLLMTQQPLMLEKK
jgi:hypothetical protein